MQFWIQLSQLALTPLIALIALYIAYQQWRTNDLKLQLELYDRRLQLYQRCRELIGKVNTNATIDAQDAVEFLRSVSEVQFLFGADVVDYVKVLGDKCIALSTAAAGARGDFGDEDRKKHISTKMELVRWIISQPEPLAQKFVPYMSFSERSFLPSFLRRSRQSKQA